MNHTTADLAADAHAFCQRMGYSDIGWRSGRFFKSLEASAP